MFFIGDIELLKTLYKPVQTIYIFTKCWYYCLNFLFQMAWSFSKFYHVVNFWFAFIVQNKLFRYQITLQRNGVIVDQVLILIILTLIAFFRDFKGDKYLSKGSIFYVNYLFTFTKHTVLIIFASKWITLPNHAIQSRWWYIVFTTLTRGFGVMYNCWHISH